MIGWLLAAGGVLAYLATREGRSASTPVQPRKRVWPVSVKRGIISPFGAHRTRQNGEARLHAGADLGAFVGDKIVAITDGEVLHFVTGFSLGAGLQAIAIRHPDAEYIYAEIMVAPGIQVGTRVKAGDVIGHVAKNSDGNSMLHIEAWTKAPKGFTEWIPGSKPAGLLNVQEMLP